MKYMVQRGNVHTPMSMGTPVQSRNGTENAGHICARVLRENVKKMALDTNFLRGRLQRRAERLELLIDEAGEIPETVTVAGRTHLLRSRTWIRMKLSAI